MTCEQCLTNTEACNSSILQEVEAEAMAAVDGLNKLKPDAMNVASGLEGQKANQQKKNRHRYMTKYWQQRKVPTVIAAGGGPSEYANAVSPGIQVTLGFEAHQSSLAEGWLEEST